jgi:hypothetical protein
MSRLEQIWSSGRLRLQSWSDPLVEALGHDPRSYYAERFWLPVLGPSTILLLRLAATELDCSPAGWELELGELARRLGLGDRVGQRAPVIRTLARCVDFEMMRPCGALTLEVRRRLPPLARRHLARLTTPLLDEHARWAVVGAAREPVASGRGDARTAPPPPPVSVLRERGRRLALSLLELGEDRAAAERHLLSWHYHPALAVECAAWAGEVHSAREASTRRGAIA